MIPIILSGGAGSRLWPLSRTRLPKPFLKLNFPNTLFQQTVMRLKSIGTKEPIIICNTEVRFMVRENLDEKNLVAKAILLEPIGRNTAPAIAVAALAALKMESDPILIILPADHIIEDNDNFKNAVSEAEKLAHQGFLVTFGVKPKQPRTGYGYIECGEQISDTAFKVSRFEEKPTLERAQELLTKENCLWNSGIFVFKAQKYLDELSKNVPDILKFSDLSLKNAKTDMDCIVLEKEAFIQCENISIDDAVMEKTEAAAIVMLDANWCDVGSWDALWDISEKDQCGNVTTADVIAKDTKNSYLHSDGRLMTTIGLTDTIVIDTKDALLITTQEKAGKVKEIVSYLKQNDRTEVALHKTVYKPWGHYDSIGSGTRDKVKRITVKPGARLSKQKHHHRAEHWVVVKGTAKVTKDDTTLLLEENEAIYIPVGTIHSVENPGKTSLEIIEVQTGEYLSEDDIVRYDDLYGRV